MLTHGAVAALLVLCPVEETFCSHWKAVAPQKATQIMLPPDTDQ